MALQKPLSIPPKILYQSILSTSMAFAVNNIKSWDGVTNLAPGDFGTKAFGAFINASRTIIEFFEFDPATIGNTTITILNRGLPFGGGQAPVPAYKLDWTANETTVLLGTDTPQFLASMFIKRFQAIVDAATVTPNVDNEDAMKITAIAQPFTIANPVGTPTDFQNYIIRIKDNGVSQAITYGTQYRAFGNSLPVATPPGKWMLLGFEYNVDDVKWDLIALVVQA